MHGKVSSASFYYCIGKLRGSLVFVHFRFSEYPMFAVSVDVLSEHVFDVVLMCFFNGTD